MPTYRAYFVAGGGAIRGRDDFPAEDDQEATAIAGAIWNAVSDRCDAFELWQGARRIDTSFPGRSSPTAQQLSEKAQLIAMERELVIGDSRWMISDSKRLLAETSRLLKQIGGCTGESCEERR